MSDSFDPSSRRPVNVDPPTWLGDDRCLELVEGGLSPAEEARQLAAMPPEMRSMVDLMRRDRQLLMSLGDEAAPPGMYAGVLARLERDVLFEEPTEDESRLLRAELDQLSTAISGRPPLAEARSLQFPASARSRMPTSSFGGQGRYALAAGMLLVIGGAMYMIMVGEGPTPLAMSGAAASRDSAPQAAPDTRVGVVTDTPAVSEPASNSTALAMDVALAPGGEPSAASEPRAATERHDESTVAVASTASPATVESTLTTPAYTAARVNTPIGIEQALELAREGRLAVRVTARNPRAVAESLAQKTSVAPDARRTWRMLPADQETIRIATAGVATREEVERWREWNRSFAMISLDAPAPVRTGVNDEAYDPRLDNGVYVIDATATPQAIGMVKSVVTAAANAASPGCAVEFIEIGESSTPVNSVEGVMWWTQPASAWVSRASIPVVVVAK